MKRPKGFLALWILWGVIFSTALAFSETPSAVAQPPHAVHSNVPASSKNSAAASPVDASGYVGSETCKNCHDDLYAGFEKTAHWKTLSDAHGGQSKQGCEGCHGPGAAHAADPSQPVFDFRTAPSKDITERCLTCHASGPTHINATNSFHRLSDVSCISCHSQHHAMTKEKLLVKAQPALCFTCHLQQKSQFNMPFRHRVLEGLVQCTDCHDQHGSGGVWESDHLVRQVRSSPSGDFVCFKCHADKQGPFVYQHASVRTQGCASCHTPHGGSNPHMLKYSNLNLLCLQCHTASLTAHAPVMDAQNSTQQQACTLCHTQIHGSNFSNLLFR